MAKNILTDGDPLNPCSTDIITQFDDLKVGEPVPDGWRVLTGNPHTSLIARVAYRYEIEEGEQS